MNAHFYLVLFSLVFYNKHCTTCNMGPKAEPLRATALTHAQLCMRSEPVALSATVIVSGVSSLDLRKPYV